jgi:hypothetical protein
VFTQQNSTARSLNSAGAAVDCRPAAIAFCSEPPRTIHGSSPQHSLTYCI